MFYIYVFVTCVVSKLFFFFTFYFVHLYILYILHILIAIIKIHQNKDYMQEIFKEYVSLKKILLQNELS